MNLVDLLIDTEAELILGNRILRGEVDRFGKTAGERYFVVWKRNRKRPLVETSNEDEAARWLIGEKP